MLDDIQIFIPTKGRLNNQKTYKSKTRIYIIIKKK